jgi:hypothetical protein
MVNLQVSGSENNVFSFSFHFAAVMCFLENIEFDLLAMLAPIIVIISELDHLC